MATFGIDGQTLSDLNIFSHAKGEASVFSYFDLTATKGGRTKLETLMKTPSNDLEKINSRISAIKFICQHDLICNLDHRYLEFIEYYLNHNARVLRPGWFFSFNSWVTDKIKPANDYYVIKRGIEYLEKHFQILSAFSDDLPSGSLPVFFQQLEKEIEDMKRLPEFKFLTQPKKRKFLFLQLNQYDHLVRKKEKERIKTMLKLTYLLDAYMSVAMSAKKYKLGFPVLIETAKPGLKIEGFFHPFIKNPVKNDIEISHENLCFVSGANMAGKSTFLKTIGLCIYLSHTGFPVPAKTMKTSVFNGLYSTINISDNINKGYSHYYSEVKRVKDIALLIKEKKRIFVIFDELFRGTNVKDAYDATLLVVKGFSGIRNSLFFVSTQIVEVGQELSSSDKIVFKCFKSALEGEKPVYNYKLSDGISADRLGLTILKNEKIIEIIDDITDREDVES